MSREVHVRIREGVWVRFPCATRLRIIFLPTYSPDLNPGEFLNNDVKANAVGRRRPASRNEMMADVRSYLHITQKHPEVVRSFFLAPSVQYAMA